LVHAFWPVDVSTDPRGKELGKSGNTDYLLKNSLVYAYENSTFYRFHYNERGFDPYSVSGIIDYYKIPSFSKEDLFSFAERMGSIDKCWCIRDRSKIPFIAKTSGSIGAGMEFPYTERDAKGLFLRLIEGFSWWGHRGEPIDAFLFEGARSYVRGREAQFIAHLTGGKVIVIRNPDEIASKLKPIEGKKLLGIVLPYVSKFLEPALNKGTSRSEFQSLYVLSIVSPIERKKGLHIQVREKYGVTLIPTYGSNEGIAGLSCPHTFEKGYCHMVADGLYHVMKGEKLSEEGEGELVITNFNREAFPLIKYRTGDLISLKSGKCLCGFTGPTVRFERRLASTVKLPFLSDHFVDVLQIEEIVKSRLPESQVLCVYGEHPKKFHFFLAIFVEPPALPTDEVAESLKAQIIQDIASVSPPSMVSPNRWNEIFPIFFVNSGYLPIEPEAHKPRILLNLMSEEPHTKWYPKVFKILREYGLVESRSNDYI